MRRPVHSLQTSYGGIRYRSRTEARWALLFDAAGIAFDYEPEGFAVGNGAYLPDFRLWPTDRGSRWFLEVKGQHPTEDEAAKCAALTASAECDMLLAIGAPDERFKMIWFDRGEQRPGLYALAQDRLADCGFWLVGDASTDDDCRWIGPLRTMETPKGPMFSGALEEAYVLARTERFDGDHKARRIRTLPHEPHRILEEAA